MSDLGAETGGQWQPHFLEGGMTVVDWYWEHHLSNPVGVLGYYDKYSQACASLCALNKHYASWDHEIWSMAPFEVDHRYQPGSCLWPWSKVKSCRGLDSSQGLCMSFVSSDRCWCHQWSVIWWVQWRDSSPASRRGSSRCGSAWGMRVMMQILPLHRSKPSTLSSENMEGLLGSVPSYCIDITSYG